MSNVTQSEQPLEPLRKSDLPWYNSEPVVKIGALVLPAFLVLMTFLDPAQNGARPGILDGIFGGLAGMILGWIATPSGICSTRQNLLNRKRGDKLWWLHGFRKHDAMVIALMIGATAASALIGWTSNRLDLGWPLVGENPTAVAGLAGFICSMSYRYAKWYGSLPD